MNTHTNKLIHESSPYLLQHAHNPVNWYPWCNEALEKAKSENKMLIISVGYAACHWCHVMEHESFENLEIADIMNEHFVCIKVDREERPDIDQIYMTALQIITGSGGWPLNCFAMPDGTPFYGGTYFRPKQWIQVLKSLQYSWLNEVRKIENAAQHLKEGVANAERIFVKIEADKIDIQLVENAVERVKMSFDPINGGQQGAPKFPMPSEILFYIDFLHFNNDIKIEKHLKLSLKKMAQGGIFDHAGGGFARYSVDQFWRVPHFEKMLYDNAQLITLFARAYKKYKIPIYKRVAEESIDFMLKELSNGNGVFYASLDADSDGAEGKYYVWTFEELAEILKQNNWLTDIFEIMPQGNWETKIILHQHTSFEEYAENNQLNLNELLNRWKTIRHELINIRNRRNKPALDDKSLTSWSALAIFSLLEAYEAFRNEKYLHEAQKSAQHLFQNCITTHFSVFRNFKNGKSAINGLLDDYAFSISAFIKLYQATANENYLEMAQNLTNYCLEHFFDPESGMFFYTEKSQIVPVARKMELPDNVIPSSNSVMAHNLHILSKILLQSSYFDIALQMLKNIAQSIPENLRFYGNWASLALKFTHDYYELAITGPEAVSFHQNFVQNHFPNVISVHSQKESHIPLMQGRFLSEKTNFWLCRNNACNLPELDLDNILLKINSKV